VGPSVRVRVPAKCKRVPVEKGGRAIVPDCEVIFWGMCWSDGVPKSDLKIHDNTYNNRHDQHKLRMHGNI